MIIIILCFVYIAVLKQSTKHAKFQARFRPLSSGHSPLYVRTTPGVPFKMASSHGHVPAA